MSNARIQSLEMKLGNLEVKVKWALEKIADLQLKIEDLERINKAKK